MKHWILGAALLCTAEQASAGTYVLDVKAADGQHSRFVDGQEDVESDQKASAVRILEPRQSSSKRLQIYIAMMNAGEAPVNFGPENVTIKLSDGTKVAMLTYDQLMAQEKRRQTWRAIGAGIAAASRGYQAGQAGYSSGTMSYNGRTSGVYGNTPYSAQTSGSGTYSGYDAGAAYAAQSQAYAQNQRDQAMLAQRHAERVSEIDGIMKTTTVNPGGYFGGTVQFDIPDVARSSKGPVPATIEITIGGDIHQFQAVVGKVS